MLTYFRNMLDLFFFQFVLYEEKQDIYKSESR